ncbi:MAG: gamma-glutamyl-gamma-aminobutyrate hydrolase family protein [Pseudomonadota bacterium]
MTRPVVGIACGQHKVEETYEVQMTGRRTLDAVRECADCLPLMIPGLPSAADINDLVATLDGVVLTGSRANVHPRFYGEEYTPAHGEMDEERDELMLPLIRAAIDCGIPIFGLCKGIQEMNVALGGTLYHEVSAEPGRHRHRMLKGCRDPELIFEKRETVRLLHNGEVSRMLDGATEIKTNSLHGQAVKDPGERVIIEGRALDDTIEIISVEDARAFTIGVQWHAEFEPENDPVGTVLFREFGNSARARQRRRTGAASAEAAG